MIEMISRIDMANIPAAARPFVQRFIDLPACNSVQWWVAFMANVATLAIWIL
jgi:hypothetical protein